MMHFKGCTCNVCNQPFQNGDDIVVCPECGAPYHRACYANEGHCVYEARHGKDFEYQPPTTAGSGNRCGNCGADNPIGNLFCENCGTPLGDRKDATQPAGGAQRVQPQQIASATIQANPFAQGGGPEQAFQSMFDAATVGREYDGISSAEWMHYIGKSAPYYLYQFSRMDESGRKTSICWSALFLAPLYFAYRKMWGWTVLSALATILVNVPSFLTLLLGAGVNIGFTLSSGTLNSLLLIGMVLYWGISIFFGVFAFHLYRQHSAKKLRALREHHTGTDVQAYNETLAHAGGTSAVAVAILCVLTLIASYLFAFWVGPEKILSMYNNLYY